MCVGKQCLEWNSPHPHKWTRKKRKRRKKRKKRQKMHILQMEIFQEPALPESPIAWLQAQEAYKVFSLPLPELPHLYCTELHSTLKGLPSASYQEHISQKKINPKSYMALPFDQLCFRFTLSHKGRGFAGNPQSKTWERYCMARYHLKMFHLFPQGTVHLKCSKFTSFWLFFSPLNFSLTHPPSHHHHHHPGS